MGQVRKDIVKYRFTPPKSRKWMFGGVHFKSELSVRSDSTFLLTEYFHISKRKDVPPEEKIKKGNWKTNKDTLYLFKQGCNGIKSKFLIRNRKLIEYVPLFKDTNRKFRTYKRYYKARLALFKWKRISPKRSSFKIAPNKE